ncbi:site-specific DNA-methyltransferase [Campylobacter upsaliensis]|uniref:site-specific DNA-methyltransferase n=1 Tax=Campylobacter upsaliensis TaxID=28080 RepID=UPI00399D6F64
MPTKQRLTKQHIKRAHIIDSTKEHNPLLDYLTKHHPQTISEERLNLDALSQALGFSPSSMQGYGLSFIGKPLANALYSTPTTKELKELDPKHSQNIIIKGDNLHALKLLKSAYDGKIKMIYIDPPYNTKNEKFIYDDNFVKEYQKLLIELDLLKLDSNGKVLEKSEVLHFLTNPSGDKAHSGWLSFMLPRLKLARDLLKDDGVIFISIDDNEQANLKILCDEIFGEENFVSDIVWNSVSSVLKQSKHIRKEHEYILVYAKNKDSLVFSKLENTMKFENPDNDPKGEWFSSNAAAANQNKDDNKFSIQLPNGDECIRNWKFSYSEFINGEVDLYFKDGNVPRLKIYKSDYSVLSKIQASILSGFGSLTSAKTEIELLLGNKELFDTPKPVNLVKHLLKISTNTGGGGGRYSA